MSFAQTALLLSILIPLAAAGPIGFFARTPNLREASTITASIITFICVLIVYGSLENSQQLTLIEPFPGVAIALKAEPLGMLFALMASFLWIVTSVYSIGYMRGHHEENQTRFYIFFAIAISCTLGAAFAANGFTLFLFYEALTLSTFPLVTHKGDEKAKKAGRIYLFILLGTSVGFLLFALIWTWQLTGHLNFQEGGIFESNHSKTVLNILLVLYAFGIGKAALMPFHRWLPTAMVAPTPVSALLHAVAVVKTGVFAILKISIYIFGVDLLSSLGAHYFVAYIAAFTIIATGIIALRKDNMKARLAYSTIGQLSYIVLGVMTANAWGIVGGGIHMLMHGFGKITLFFCAGAILVATHKTEISQMRGIGRKMPITMAAFLIGSISIVGAPPTGGMWSKWYLLVGIVNTYDWFLLGALILGSILSAAYLLPVAIRAFYPTTQNSVEITEAPLSTRIAMMTCSAGCIVLFIAPDFAYELMSSLVNLSTP